MSEQIKHIHVLKINGTYHIADRYNSKGLTVCGVKKAVHQVANNNFDIHSNNERCQKCVNFWKQRQAVREI